MNSGSAGALALVIGTLVLSTSATAAWAQASGTTSPVDPDPNITAYPASFFVEFRPITALDMIGRIPGFQFDGGSSGRGFAGTVGNILIDGERPPVRSDSLQSILSRIPASQVERIDIVRAGAGGIDMAGKAVVANVIRRPERGLSGSVSATLQASTEGRLNPNFNLQIQRQAGGRSIEAALNAYGGSGTDNGFRERRSQDGQLLLLGGSDGVFDYGGAEATSVYEGPLGGGRVRLNGLIQKSYSGYEGSDLLLVPAGEERNLSDFNRTRAEVGARWTRSLPLGMTLEMVGSQQYSQSDSVGEYNTPDFTSGSVNEETSAESIGSASVKFASLATPWGEIDFETGSEIAFNFVESATSFRFNESSLLLPGDDTRVEELRSESFVSAVWAPRPNLSITTALRYERSRITAEGSGGTAETNLSFLKPRLNVSWTPRPNHSLAFRLERNVDQLSFGAFRASAAFATGIFGRGNPDIRPAQTWIGSVRYERVFDRQGSFVAELTHEELDEVLGQVVVVEALPGETQPRTFNVTRNVGTARRDTARLTGRLPLDRFGMSGGIASASVQVRKSETEDPVTFVDRRLSGEQPTSWSLGLSQNLAGQKITWSLSISSGQSSRSFGPSTVSTFSNNPSFSGNLSWRPDPGWSLSAGLSLAGDTESRFTLFGGPRNRFGPLYDERSASRGTLTAFLSARRSF
jgi:hypothetical protein